MRNTISILIIVSAIAVPAAILAAEPEHAAKHQQMQSERPEAAVTHAGRGVVDKIDLPQGKVNLTHGPIKTLGWMGMTMDFNVKDPAILKNIKPGQQVKFDVVKLESGRFYITRVEPVK
jgi:Cu/Ag efflux protein CusF